MGYKVFVSYKYWDQNVEMLIGAPLPTMVHDYVDYIQAKVLSIDDVYKGEKSNEDISLWPEYKIEKHLRDKIYDSSITIVLISPNMKEPGRWQKSQWIPWEIAYSLRETTRNNRTSHNNAILAVILPDRNGHYDYYNKNTLFPILRRNIENNYIHVVKWSQFIADPKKQMVAAFERRNTTPNYLIVKTLD